MNRLLLINYNVISSNFYCSIAKKQNKVVQWFVNHCYFILNTSCYCDDKINVIGRHSNKLHYLQLGGYHVRLCSSLSYHVLSLLSAAQACQELGWCTAVPHWVLWHYQWREIRPMKELVCLCRCCRPPMEWQLLESLEHACWIPVMHKEKIEK